jgi:DNA-binding MarR family transcriptional regulator
MDDYIEETPEEREAGRKMMRDMPVMIEKFLKATSPEEAEAIIKAFAEANKGG